MGIEEVTQKLEELSKAVVLLDSDDLQAMTALHTRLQEISKMETLNPIRDAAFHLAGQVEKLVLNEIQDKEKVFEKLSETLSDMQAMARNGDESDLQSAGGSKETRDNQDSVASINLPSNADEEIFKNFLSRQDSVLEEMENLILADENEHQTARTDALKRIIHTLKGEAGVLGLADVEKLCHQTEDFIENEKEKDVTDQLLKVKDWLSQKFSAIAGDGEAPSDVAVMLEQLKPGRNISAAKNSENLSKGKEDIADAEAAAEKPEEELLEFEEIVITEGMDASLIGDFIMESNDHLHQSDTHLLELESNPTDNETINAVFRAFHTIKGVSGFLGFDAIGKLAHSTENLLDRSRKGEITLDGERIDIVFTAVDAMKKEIESLQTALENSSKYKNQPALPRLINEIKRICAGKPSADGEKIGDILVRQGKASQNEVDEALKEQIGNPGEKIGEILVEKGTVTPGDISDALEQQQVLKKNIRVKESIKVDTERLDRLVDTIGELVITEAMVTGDQEIISRASAGSLRNIRQLDKITRELQEIGLSMRMVSIKSTFQKMARLVRDLSKKAGKEIKFVTAGEETELDKTIIEKIGDPLVHMVRNSADHGIEEPAEREKAGKPKIGTLSLRAFQKGGTICIEIRDDGKGLNREAILEKARKNGLIKENDTLSDQDIYQLIFRPGFSTAKKITDVSGRGVGMDVVKKSIEALRGSVEISTEAGKGTTFSMHLPLTMAIMDGMVVRVDQERYIIPTLSVVETFRPVKEDLSTALQRGELVMVHGNLVPLFRLSRLFGLKNAIEDPTKGIVMIVEDMDKRMGLLIDGILGQQQTVIKKLGEGVGKVAGISGGAVMPDGRISLIIDVAEIMRISSQKNEKPEAVPV